MASKIEEYGLTDTAIQMFREGQSFGKIAAALNTMLPEGAEPVSTMAVYRLRKNPVIDSKVKELLLADSVGSVSANVQQDEEINPYIETCRLIEDCDVQIDTIKARLQATKKATVGSKYELDNMGLLANLISRKQSLLKDVALYQKDLANIDNVKKMMKIMVELMKQEAPDAYNTFKERLVKEVKFQTLLK